MTNTLWLASPLVNLVTQQNRHGAPGSNITLPEFRLPQGLMMIRARFQASVCLWVSVCVCVVHMIMLYQELNCAVWLNMEITCLTIMCSFTPQLSCNSRPEFLTHIIKQRLFKVYFLNPCFQIHRFRDGLIFFLFLWTLEHRVWVPWRRKSIHCLRGLKGVTKSQFRFFTLYSQKLIPRQNKQQKKWARCDRVHAAPVCLFCKGYLVKFCR